MEDSLRSGVMGEEARWRGVGGKARERLGRGGAAEAGKGDACASDLSDTVLFFLVGKGETR